MTRPTPEAGVRWLRWLRYLTVLVLLAGAACQVIQYTDPASPQLYFTWNSAVLLAVVLLASTARPTSRLVAEVRGAATVGVLLSGLVFAAVIAPATQTGTWFQPHDDPWVRTANLLLHGVGPVLALTDFALTSVPLPGAAWRVALRWCAWPLLYLAVIVPVDLLGFGQIPYPFLRVESGGDVLPVVGAVVVLLVVVLGFGAALVLLRRRIAGAVTAASRQPVGPSVG